jgi:putative hydrolase of the HAD superfamily
VKCVVATNNEKHRVQYMSSAMGFSEMFDGIYASADVGHMKPDAAFYETVLADLQVAEDHVLFFDDSQRNVTAASQLGINAELYTTFEAFRTTLKQYRLINE